MDTTGWCQPTAMGRTSGPARSSAVLPPPPPNPNTPHRVQITCTYRTRFSLFGEGSQERRKVRIPKEKRQKRKEKGQSQYSWLCDLLKPLHCFYRAEGWLSSPEAAKAGPLGDASVWKLTTQIPVPTSLPRLQGGLGGLWSGSPLAYSLANSQNLTLGRDVPCKTLLRTLGEKRNLGVVWFWFCF
jgi:hypothetical protein